jgi:hypothetical protein
MMRFSEPGHIVAIGINGPFGLFSFYESSFAPLHLASLR